MFNKSIDIKIKYENIYGFVFLVFLCVLYAVEEVRIPFEILFILIFTLYFFTRRKRLTLFFLWNLLFIIICALSIFNSSNIEQSLIETRKLIEWAIVSNLLIAFVDNKEKLLKIYNYFVIAGTVLLIRLVIRFPISDWLDGRLGDEAFNSNRIGLYLSISLICSLYLGFYKKNKIYFLIAILFASTVLLTGSRKAFIMIVLGIAILYFINSTKISKKIIWVLTLPILMLLSYFIITNVPSLYDIIGYRVENLVSSYLSGSEDYDLSTTVRFGMIDTGISLFMERPIIGHGIASYEVISGYGVYAHNNYIELLVGTGLIGTLLYYSMIIYLIIKLFIYKGKLLGNPILVLLLLLLVMDYGLVSYNGAVYQLLIAVGFIAIRILRQTCHTRA
ncbi:hypothetical protein J18TS1_27440 [Oceanobacillus oncorhynchi subsp. incaldanensis]|uniref:O-antigen ligase family protein n=1 Tax=Oceanobacillus oncorhynchi TaxID=545501 RepID=UPI001B2E9278|nr:O-antigen ligase family protein [Oceanobacillus oncorhynchi]GIO19644.1 hypothetical protein J18TS1_27440 [Oceanobacillus oncorhynchi subsp. incaldanensis]